MVTMQRCKDHASSNNCTSPPSKFQRHHHCRLLTLSQHSAQTCADELQCKHPRNLTCSSAWRSNIAALQWLFPRHTYCSDSITKEVRALFIWKMHAFYPVCAVSNRTHYSTSTNCWRWSYSKNDSDSSDTEHLRRITWRERRKFFYEGHHLTTWRPLREKKTQKSLARHCDSMKTYSSAGRNNETKNHALQK